MFLSMMKSRLNFLIVLSRDIQAGRNILTLSPVWFLSERSEIRIMPKIYQKQLHLLWIRGWHSIRHQQNPMGSEWLFRSSQAGPFFAQKKKKLPLFSYIALSSLSGSTKQMNCILSSLLYDDTMEVNTSYLNLNVLAVKIWLLCPNI